MIYLDNAASTPCLESVMAAMRDANGTWSNVHRGLHAYAEATTDRFEDARGQVADFIGADISEIVFTSGTTDSINMVACGLEHLIEPGDDILVTVMDHHSNLVPWQALAQRTGARLRVLPVTFDGSFDFAAYHFVLNKRTKIVAFPAVSNVLGTVNPVAKIVQIAHETGALTVVDAAQSVPNILQNVHRMDVDFLAFSGHKLHGPTGVGVLYVRDSNLLAPTRFGGGMVTNVTEDSYITRSGLEGLEAGTPPIQQAIGLGEACWYWDQLDMHEVRQHIKALTYEAYSRLEATPGIHILGPPRDKRISIISFTVEGIHPHDVAALLSEHGIAVRAGHHCALPLHRALGIPASVRVSFSYFNTSDDIDALILALENIQRTFKTP